MTNHAKKKLSPSTAISDASLLAYVETVLSLIYNNPHDLDAAEEIKKHIRTFIPFDYYHYVLKMGSEDEGGSRLEISIQNPERRDQGKLELSPRQTFEKALQIDYEDCIKEFHKQYGKTQKFDYCRIQSNENPWIAVGLFRCTDKAGKNHFTSYDKALLDRLASHIFLLYRIVFHQVYNSENIQYFAVFLKLASKLANEHHLSDTEVKLIPDLIFGSSNETIAQRHFISVATVKTHINHILKKTNTKNRLDFIGKFFTSPEHVQL